MQQCVYQMAFRNVYEFKKRLEIEFWISLEQNIIDTAVNAWRNHLRACVCIMGTHFEQLSSRQLKKKQLDKMSGNNVRNVIKMCFCVLFR